jgi:diacylglycerol kinase (ATP)
MLQQRGVTLSEQLRMIHEGKAKAIDIGRVNYHTESGPATRHFLNIASVGIGGSHIRIRTRIRKSNCVAMVCRSVNEAWHKSLGGFISFWASAVSNTFTFEDRPARFRVDNGQWQNILLHNFCVCNGQYQGGGMWIAPNASLDDGTLDLSILHGVNVATSLFKINPRIYKGRLDQLPQYHTAARGSVIELEHEHLLYLEADGEVVGHTPCRWEVVPRAVNLVSALQ